MTISGLVSSNMKTFLRRSIYLVVVILIALMEYGYNGGLTRCMWSHSQMEVYRTERIDKYYVSSSNPDKIYLEWISHNGKQNRIEVDFSNISDFSKRMLITNIALYKRFNTKLVALVVRDYSSVPRTSRKYYRYTLLVPEEIDLAQDDDIHVYSLYFSKARVTTLKALPQDIVLSTCEYIPNVEIEIYKVNEKSVWKTAAKAIATPFTLVADVIAIPASIVYFGLTWKWP